jgi:pimeloyl-ACP methyl ester carboxylesterase
MERDDKDKDVGFVLLHGSELGAWQWDRLVPLLRRPALPVDLPGRGSRPADRRSLSLDDAVRSVVADVDAWGADRVILVAHSFSGILLPALAGRLGDRVAAVVLVGAHVPEEGRCWVDLQPPAQRAFLRLLYRLRPGGVLSPRGSNRKTLCNDLDEETTTLFLDRRIPEVPRFLLDPVSPAAFPPAVPRHYVRLLQDRSISEAARERMIARLPGAQVHDLDSGHLPMLGRPGELAAILDEVAEASLGAARSSPDG